MKETIRQRALELGFESCRFTTAAPPHSGPEFQQWLLEQRHGLMAYLERHGQKRLDPQQILPGAQTIICVAASYARAKDAAAAPSQARVTTAEAPPTSSSKVHKPLLGFVARYARYADYHEVMGRQLAGLARFVESLDGGTARSLWYVDTGPVLERDFAQRAGIGFVGKHTNIISRSLGNWILLGEVITTLVLPADEPEVNRCGSCARCIAACPTGAITAPFRLDARRCISYLTIELKGPIPLELRPAIGNRVFGCDDCLAACPWNRFAREGRLMQSHARPELAGPDLIELLGLDDAAFKRRFAGTPILRSKRRGLLRNVCVALGNLADERALPALAKAARDPEPLIAEHAAWAIQRIESKGEVEEISLSRKGRKH